MRKTIEDFRRLLEDRFDALIHLCNVDVDVWDGWRIRDWVEEAQTQACRFGCDLVTAEKTALTPREALPIIGKLLAWVDEKKRPDDFLTVRQSADRLRVSPRCVYDLIECGRLKCQRIGTGRGTIRIRPADLERCNTTSGKLKHL